MIFMHFVLAIELNWTTFNRFQPILGTSDSHYLSVKEARVNMEEGGGCG